MDFMSAKSYITNVIMIQSLNVSKVFFLKFFFFFDEKLNLQLRTQVNNRSGIDFTKNFSILFGVLKSLRKFCFRLPNPSISPENQEINFFSMYRVKPLSV